MDFILERLNERDKTRFVLDKNGGFFSCGRCRTNKIVCCSEIVSRKHCMFHRSDDELYVTDLGSSNGIFINGREQETRQSIKLYENDIIGIGTADINADDDKCYAYKFYIVKPLLSNKEAKVESNMSNAVFNNGELLREESTSSTNCVLGEKRKSNSTNCDKSVPCKIKCTNNKECNFRINLSEGNGSESSHENKQNPHTHNTNNLIKVRTDIVHMEAENDDIEIIHTSLSTKEKSVKNTKNSDPLSPKYLNNNDKSNFNHKIFQYSTTSRENCQSNEAMDIDDEDKNNYKKDKNKRIHHKNKHTTEKISNSIDKTNNPLNITKSSNSTHANNEVTKIKNKQQRMSDDEKATTVNHKTICNESPIKKVKQESTRFSEIDIIDISDEEDGLFPYSQLFDSRFEENIESKVKMEYDNNDDQNNLEKNDSDVDYEVVILSDSEDENNPWLERLSRSQIINEDNESNNVFIKEEVDLGIWEADELADIIKSVPHTYEVFDNKDTSLELDTNVDDENKEEDKNNNADLIKKENVMNIDDVGLSKEPNSENADTNKGRTDIEQDTNKLDKEKDINKLGKEKISVESTKPKERKSVTTTKMLIPVIDAIPLPKRRRQTDRSKDKTSKAREKKSPMKSKAEENEKLKIKLRDSYNKDHKQETSKSPTDCYSPSETKTGSSISKDEKRIIIEKRKEKLKEIAAEEKKLTAKNDQNIQRRIAKPRAKISLKNRGDFLIADCEQEPSVSKSFPDKSTKVPKSSTKCSKERFADHVDILKKSTTSDIGRNRTKDVSKDTVNDTLLQQTTKVPKSSTNHSKERLADHADILKKSTTSDIRINRIKDVSKDTVNDTLLQQTIEVPKSSTNRSKERLADHADKLNKSMTSDIGRNRTKNVSKSAVNSTSLQQTSHLNPFICLNTVFDTNQVPKDNAKSSRTADKERKHNDSKETKRSNENMSESRDRFAERRTSTLVQKETKEAPNVLKSNLVKSNSRPKMKRKVTFSEKPLIKEYEIDPDNSMKKLVGKDAPIPTNKLTKKSTVSVNCAPKLEEFLLRIFMWNPVWLDEQRTLNKEPPIVSSCEIQPMKLSYNSYKQYYEVVMPLLLHEIWYTMTKELEKIEKNIQRPIMICSIVQNSITHIPITSTNLFLTTMMIEVLVNRTSFNKSMHPGYGDLVVLQLNIKKQSFQIFAYVTNVYQMLITDFTHYKELRNNYVQNPYAVMTYTLLTRPLDHYISVNRVQRVRTVMYLRANMRMVQALQYLPQSSLFSPILNPKIEDYHLPPMIKSYTPNSLVTKDNLNPKQLEAVFRVSQTVLNKESKLCFIQGPPGTGKSKVIVNLVAQILYSNENTNNKKPLKILVCAPSNAAIDEIVLRLINIRSILKEKGKGFNMVRIGRPETMHPLVKTISVTDLAKQHLRKSLNQHKSPSDRDNIAMIETRLKSLELRLSSEQMISEAGKRQELKRDILITKIDYELKKCGKAMEEFTPKERAKFQRMAENLFLTGADIITCTLSSCYTNLMESTYGDNKEKISVCIVDEATQSCEAETLIPLMLGVNTLVLVGDPNQLPATIISRRAKMLGLDRSIFSRMQTVFGSQPHSPIIMLDTQYRMDYSISYWPNRYFYQGKLKNATEWNLNFPFHGYKVLNHNSVQDDDKFSNSTEAEFVANIIYAMLMFPKWEENTTISLGVLTPYNNQRTLVLNKINEKIFTVPDKIKKKINFEVNTVDGFQGQERDVIIMSCVRSHGIGFLSDKQRLCVALTRAKYSLILCGNFNTFRKDQMWQALLNDAQTRGNLCSVNANATPGIIKKFILK